MPLATLATLVTEDALVLPPPLTDTNLVAAEAETTMLADATETTAATAALARRRPTSIAMFPDKSLSLAAPPPCLPPSPSIH